MTLRTILILMAVIFVIIYPYSLTQVVSEGIVQIIKPNIKIKTIRWFFRILFVLGLIFIGLNFNKDNLKTETTQLISVQKIDTNNKNQPQMSKIPNKQSGNMIFSINQKVVDEKIDNIIYHAENNRIKTYQFKTITPIDFFGIIYNDESVQYKTILETSETP